MPKAVLKLDLQDLKGKKKAMKIVSGTAGVHSISIDMKDKKMTVVGAIDVVGLTSKLRKIVWTEIVSVEPVRAPPPLYRYGRYV